MTINVYYMQIPENYSIIILSAKVSMFPFQANLFNAKKLEYHKTILKLRNVSISCVKEKKKKLGIMGNLGNWYSIEMYILALYNDNCLVNLNMNISILFLGVAS